MRAELSGLREALGGPGAAGRAAEALLEEPAFRPMEAVR